jgi:hypothetical protein
MTKSTIFKVTFINNGKLYEVYARQVCQSSLLGFVEIGDYVFDKSSGIVIDPSEERLKKEFADIKRSYIPMHSVIRIDEVKKKGTSKISDLPKDGKVISPFPGSPIIPPDTDKSGPD